MIDQWLSDPSKVGATGLLLLAIVAFYRVLILPRQIHVDALAQMATSHEKTIKEMKELHAAAIADMKALHIESSHKYEADIKREREESERLRAMVLRNVDVVEKTTDTLRLALAAFEKAHAVRRDVFENKPAQE